MKNKKKVVAVYPLHKNNSAYFAITETAMNDEKIELIDFLNIIYKPWKYISLDAVFLNFYENLSACGRLQGLKIAIKFVYKIFSLGVLKALHIPIIVTIHNYKSHDKGKWLENNLMRVTWKFSDKLIILCNKTKEYIGQEKNGKKLIDKCFYIPHPEYSLIYKENDVTDFRKDLEIKSTDFVVLLFGMVRPYKNIEILLEAADRVNSENIKFIIAGDGSNKEYVSEISKEVKKRENVFFINRFIEDYEMANLIIAANVLALPYEVGSLNSGPVLAALTFGKKVVCSSIGTIFDYSKEYFYLYSYDNREDHVENLTKQIDNAYEKFSSQLEEEKLAEREKIIAEVRRNASERVIHNRYVELYNLLW